MVGSSTTKMAAAAAPCSETSSTPIYTPAEAQARSHPDVAFLMARDPVCASMLKEPSVRIWAPPPVSTDEQGNRSVRVATSKVMGRTLNTVDTIDHLFYFWDEMQPELFPQSLVTVTNIDGSPVAGVGTDAESRPAASVARPLKTGEGSVVGISGSSSSSSSPSMKTTSTTAVAAAISPVLERLNTIHAFITVGDGVEGWGGIVHGGILATILDEVTGHVPRMNRIRGSPIFKGGHMTGYLNTKYHRLVRTPGPLLVTARISKVQGRKCWLEGEVRSTAGGKGLEGPVLVNCEALYIALPTERPVL